MIWDCRPTAGLWSPEPVMRVRIVSIPLTALGETMEHRHREAYHRVYNKEWYKRPGVKERVYQRLVERRKKTLEWFIDYKKKQKCIRCEEADFRCLDFHHTGGKDGGILDLIYKRGYSIERIKKELERCVPMCSNCHRILHWDEKLPLGK